MKQHTALKYCRLHGLNSERAGLQEYIRIRQAKHKAVAGLQARLNEVTNEIEKMELDHG